MGTVRSQGHDIQFEGGWARFWDPDQRIKHRTVYCTRLFGLSRLVHNSLHLFHRPSQFFGLGRQP